MEKQTVNEGLFDKNLQKRLKKFCNRVMGLRMVIDDSKIATVEDMNWAIDEAKELLRLIDKFHGVKVRKADHT